MKEAAPESWRGVSDTPRQLFTDQSVWRGANFSVLRDKGAAFVTDEECVDVLEVVDAGLKTGVEDHVFDNAAREVVPCGVQQDVRIASRESQGEGELDGRAL